MAEESPLPEWRIRESRERHEERRRQELASYGEEEYARRSRAKDAVIGVLCERVKSIALDAKKRGFSFFACELNLGTRNMPIRLEFADGEGAYFEKSLGLMREALKQGLKPTLPEASDINAAVHNYVRSIDGIRMLRPGMTRHRVRATAGE